MKQLRAAPESFRAFQPVLGDPHKGSQPTGPRLSQHDMTVRYVSITSQQAGGRSAEIDE